MPQTACVEAIGNGPVGVVFALAFLVAWLRRRREEGGSLGLSMVSWQLTIDSNDPARMARFWAPLLGYVPQLHRTASTPGWPTTGPWYRR